MYSQLPRVDRVALRGSVAAGWVASAFSAVGGIWFTGVSVAAAASPMIITVSASVTLAGSLLALCGILIGGKRWWLEWIGAALAGAGMTYYVTVPWWYLFQGDTGRMQQAGVTTIALLGFIAHRIIVCWSHSRKLARQHQEDKLLIVGENG